MADGFNSGRRIGFTDGYRAGQADPLPLPGEHDIAEVIEAAERYGSAENMATGEVLNAALECIEDIEEETKDNLMLTEDIENFRKEVSRAPAGSFISGRPEWMASDLEDDVDQFHFDARGNDRTGRASGR